MADVAVIDSCAVIYLLGGEVEDPVLRERQENTRRTVEWAQERCQHLVVPTPVLAELAYADMPAQAVLRAFAANVGARVDLEPFDAVAAHHAGEALRALFPDRQPGENRHQMKFDVQIAAIAHSIQARYLVTGDESARGFPRYLRALESETHLLIGPELPPGYQLDILDGYEVADDDGDAEDDA